MKRTTTKKEKASPTGRLLVYLNICIYTFIVYAFLSYELAPPNACAMPLSTSALSIASYPPIAWIIITMCTIGLVLNATKVMSLLDHKHPHPRYYKVAILIVLVMLLVLLSLHYDIRCLL